MEITSISGLAAYGCAAFGFGGFSVLAIFRLQKPARRAPEPARRRVQAMEPDSLSPEAATAVFGINDHYQPSPGLDELASEYLRRKLPGAADALGARTEPVPVITDLGIDPTEVYPPGRAPDMLSSEDPERTGVLTPDELTAYIDHLVAEAREEFAGLEARCAEEMAPLVRAALPTG